MVSLDRLRRPVAVPLVVCLLSGLGLLTVGALELLPRPTLLRAGFTVIGAVVALAVFVASSGDRPAVQRRLPPDIATHVVILWAASAVIVTAFLETRVLPFALILPVGLLLVAAQLRAEPSVPAVLTQLSALFLAGRLGKYLTTGFYFGGSDTFAHVGAVQTLVRVRYTTAIPHGYDLYPVFHFVVGTVTHATGLPPYDALVLTGIALFTLVVPTAYLLGWSVFGSQRLGLLAALSVTVLEFFSYHAVYFYPQALASVLILVALYLTSRLRETTDGHTFRRLSVFVLALVTTMVVTHHLAYILFGLVAAVAIPVALTRPLVFDTSLRESVGRLRYRWLFPGVVGAVFLLVYWSYSPSLITVGIVQLTVGLVLDVASSPAPQLYTYGVTLPVDSIERAVAWLLTPTGVYASGLGSLLLLAGYELLENRWRYRRGFTLAVTGLVLAALLLPLPIPIPQLERLKFAVTLVAVFPVAIGLGRALSVERRYAAVALVLVAAVGGGAAFTVLTADDVPEVYIDEPREQVSMSEDEFQSLGMAASFLREYGDGPAATDRLTNRGFETARYNATRVLRAQPSGLRTGATYVVARPRWTGRPVALGDGLRSGELNIFAVSGERFAVADETQTKVYDADHVRIYRSEDGFRRLYGENGSAR